MRYPCIMTNEDAEQLALDGLAPRKRRKRAPAVKTPAAEHPIAQVVLDIQATHLGQTFDYFVEEKYSAAAQPGVMVRVRFGGQRVNGIIWKRADTSATPESSIRYIERVVTDRVLVPESMRDDMTRIADAFGGTRANILRLAVPPRVAKVESQLRVGNRDAAGTAAGKQRLAAVDQEIYGQLQRQYGNINLLHDALQGRRFQSFVFDLLPGADHWRRCAAWMVAAALAQNKPAVLVLPTMREIADMTETLRSVGLKPFAPIGAANGVYDGDFAVLNAQMAPADRYRAYLAISCGQVRCVLGTRAAMYAPVEGNALFLILDDVCYQDADGMMPYANARGVLRLRAKSHNGVFVAMANARSAQSQWETDAAHVGDTQVSGFSTPIHALPAVTKEASPWIRWLNRDELARLADPTIGARVPHTAVRILSKALETGPVLLSIPQDGITEALSCSKCHRQVRCARCTGPLERLADGTIRCRWCGAATVQWSCPTCHNERMRVVRVGAAGTAMELARLFRGVPMVLSTPAKRRRVRYRIRSATGHRHARRGAACARGESGTMRIPCRGHPRRVDQFVCVRHRRRCGHVDRMDARGVAVRAADPWRTGAADRGNRSRARTIVDAVEFADACPSRSGGPRPDRAAAGIRRGLRVGPTGCGWDDVETNRRVGRRRHGHHRHDRRYDAVRLGAGADSAATHHRFT